MARVRTCISISGFTAEEAVNGLPHLREEFANRPWLLSAKAHWDGARSRLLVEVEAEGEDARMMGGTGGANLDEVWDCVIATCNFSSDGIHFDVDESTVIE